MTRFARHLAERYIYKELKLFRLSFYLCLILSFSVYADQKQIEIKNSDFIGVWSLNSESTDDFPYSFSQLAFTETGEKCVVIYEFNALGVIEPVYYLNKYKVEGDLLVTTYGFNTRGFFPPGFILKDRIDSISKNKFTLFMQSPITSDEAEVHIKLDGVNPESLCSVVRTVQYNKSKAI